MGNLKAIFIGMLAAAVVLIGFVAWRGWSSTSSTPSQPATTTQQPAPTPATRPAAPARVAGTQQGPYVPLRPASRVQRRANPQDDYVLQQWTAAVRRPAPDGGRWRRITPRPTGEYGCTPGATRPVFKGGRWVLQGCR